jgi:chloramphenicol-sensitive protein RarD
MTPAYLRGLFAALAAFVAWGLVPIYWRQIREVPAFEILAHRAIWSLFLVALLLTWYRQWSEVVQTGRSLAITALRGVLVSANWCLFIWAVNAGYIVETSMGYFITPLLNLVFGMLVFSEKLRPLSWLAVVLAVIGVLVATTEAHRGFPWIAISIALTFASYGTLKKLSPIRPMPGLFLETALMTPFAIAYLLLKPDAVSLLPVFSHTPLYLIGGGIVTALPLLWFAQAAQTLRLTTMSFINFLAPSLSFLVGVFVYHESFSTTRLVAFVFIWAGVIVFTLDAIFTSRQPRDVQPTPVVE